MLYRKENEDRRDKAMTAEEAAQSLIDGGGRFLMTTSDKTPVALAKGCRVKWSLPEGKRRGTDADRLIYEYDRETKVKVRERDYLASEVSERLISGIGRVGLFGSLVDCGLCVVDYDEGVDSADAWIPLMGDPLVVLPSGGGRGFHAWYRYPLEVNGRLPSKTTVILPSLTGGDPVKADLIFRAAPVGIADADALIALAAAVRSKGKEACRLRGDVADVFHACREGDSPLRDELTRLVKVGKGSRHNALLDGFGKAWQGDLRAGGVDGFLARAYGECVLAGGGEHSRSRADVMKTIDEFALKRFEEWEGESGIFKGKRAGVKTGGECGSTHGERKPVVAVNADGFASIMGDLGIGFARDRFGRQQYKVDFGGGEGWQVMDNGAISLIRGRAYANYLSRKKDDTLAPWNMTLDLMRSLAQADGDGNRLDLFGDYYESLPDIDYDEAAEQRLLEFPMRFWDFEVRPEDEDLVGKAFRAFMCGAICRHKCPGSKFDLLTVLKGPQGKGKSSIIRALFPGHARFNSLVGKCNLKLLGENGGDKRLVENTMGRVICEVPEMKGMGKHLDLMKDFITSADDDMRLAYGSDSLKMPRTAVFVATTNREEPLAFDPSGYRRFVVLPIRDISKELYERGEAHRRKHSHNAPQDEPYQSYELIRLALDGDLDGEGFKASRDEWWTLAKAAVKAEGKRIAKESGVSEDEVWNEDRGNRLLHFTGYDEHRIMKLQEGSVRSNSVTDDVAILMEGLRLDPPSIKAGGVYALDVIPFDALTSALGLSRDDGRGIDPKDRYQLLDAMQSFGWHYSRLRFKEIGQETTREVRRYVFYHEDKPPEDGVRAEVDVRLVDDVLTAAKDGIPITPVRYTELTGCKPDDGGGKGLKTFAGGKQLEAVDEEPKWDSVPF